MITVTVMTGYNPINHFTQVRLTRGTAAHAHQSAQAQPAFVRLLDLIES